MNFKATPITKELLATLSKGSHHVIDSNGKPQVDSLSNIKKNIKKYSYILISQLNPPRWQVISPDGISISHTASYKDKETAEAEYTKWAARFEPQGYYSSNNGRIELSELRDCCTFKEIE